MPTQILTLKTISSCLLDLERNWNIQIDHLKNSLVTAQNEITSLKSQLDVKEKLLKTYETRATATVSLDPMPKVEPFELPQNAFQPIIGVPQNREKRKSTSPQIEEIKADQTIEPIKREVDDVVDITFISQNNRPRPVNPDRDVTHFESLTIEPSEAPITNSSVASSTSSKKRRIEQDDEIPLDVVLRESNQQKLTRLNKSMGDMVCRHSISGPSNSAEPSVARTRTRIISQKERCKNQDRDKAPTNAVQSRNQSVWKLSPRPSSPATRPKSPTIMLDLKCTLCQARIKTLEEYRLHHQQEHPKSKHLICEYCPYATINKLNYSHHLRTHNENQNHPDAERCRGGCNLYFVTPRIHTAHLHKYHYQSLTNIEQQLSQ